MRWLIDFLRSSIGAKMLMAITGISLVLFVIVHMLANLQMFVGQATFNAYGHGLRKMPALLWTARAGVLIAVLIHIGSAIRLTVINKRARPERYRYTDYRAAGYASRTMVASGFILFAFIGFHLAHYTLFFVDGSFSELRDQMGRHDAYTMVVKGFSHYIVSGFYLVAVGLLCAHLAHGIPSFFQTLGLRHPRYTPILDVVGPAVALAIFLGFASVPIAVMAKWVTLTGGV